MPDTLPEPLQDAVAKVARGDVETARTLADAAVTGGFADALRDAFSAVDVAAPRLVASLMADVLLRTGRPQEAMDTLQQALRRHPDAANLWHQLGAIHGNRREWKAAVLAFDRALRLDPESEAIHEHHAAALRASGGPAAVVRAYEALRAALPRSPRVLDRLVRAYVETGNVDAARTAIVGGLAFGSVDPELIVAVAHELEKEGKHQAAIRLLAGAAHRLPDEPLLPWAMGRVLQRMGNADGAREAYARTAERFPDYAPAHAGVWSTLRSVDGASSLREARQHLERAIALEPDEPTWRAMMDIHEQMERTADAAAGAPEDIETNHNRALAWAQVADGRSEREAAVAVLRKHLANVSSRHAERDIRFALARLLDKLGAYDEAWEMAARANALRVWPTSRSTDADMFARIRAAHAVPGFADLPRASVDGSRAVLVVGMPRSGTSLVEQILASHSQVHGAGELHALNRAQQLANRAFRSSVASPENVPLLDREVLDLAARSYLEELRRADADAHRVVDKMPHNFLRLGFVHRVLPGATVLHAQRHPLDTCLSIWFHDFAGAHRYAYDLRLLGTHYRLYRDLMRFWRDIGVEFLDVPYEDVVADQPAMARRLLDHLGLPFEPGVLEPHKTRRAVTTSSHQQVNKPVYRSSVERWRNYEKHLGPLVDALEGR